MRDPLKILGSDLGGKFRGSLAKGLSGGAGDDPAVLPGIALITRGEALGHGVWIDQSFVASVGAALKSKPEGVKSRFTHPSLSADGLGKFLGRVTGGDLDASGDIVRGSLKFAEVASNAPDGDLAGYVRNLAKEDPESFGASIVFEHDEPAMIEFALANGAEWAEDRYGRYLSLEKYKSPDPLNTKNMLHVRLKSLVAVDIVDEPAANPDGLFHRSNPLHEDAEKLIGYLTGETKIKPQLSALGADADRVAGFVKKALANRNLEIKAMADKEPPKQVKTGSDYIAAFGTQGAVWFAEGKTWEEAQALHDKDIKAQLSKAQADLAAKDEAHKAELAAKDKAHADALAAKDEVHKVELAAAKQAVKALSGEEQPVSANTDAEADKSAKPGKFENVLSKGAAGFAASLKLPGKTK
jgi:hypothetical protein